MQKTTPQLPRGFAKFANDLVKEVESVEGYLSPIEMHFLALLAACPPALGEVLEIGSFKGKSTIILAKAASLTDNGIINAVDPMTAPSETDPDLKGDLSSLSDFLRNLAEHEVQENVRFHQTYSFELAKTWDKPLRLLWIDGDHTYIGTRVDFEGFAPHLSDGAIVAMHDVLHEFEGGARVFMENILLSPNFGACGFCGSIAWGQFRSDVSQTRSYHPQKLKLYSKVSKLIPFLAFGFQLEGWRKKKYKFYRAMVPHAAVDPEAWLEQIQ